jgi:hypothetical protein
LICAIENVQTDGAWRRADLRTTLEILGVQGNLGECNRSTPIVVTRFLLRYITTGIVEVFTPIELIDRRRRDHPHFQNPALVLLHPQRALRDAFDIGAIPDTWL